MGTSTIPIDLLTKESDKLASYLEILAESRVSGQPPDAGVLELSQDLLDRDAQRPIADAIVEEFAKDGGPDIDPLMLLHEQSEMLASLQKEYYVINNRHDRIGRFARGISAIKHAGGENGAVRNRIKQAGGAL